MALHVADLRLQVVRPHGERGEAKPHVHASFSFDEAAAAHAEIEEGKNVGKVVLTP